MKKLLITGGAGFIGSHIVEHGLVAGYDVSVIDNFSTGSRKNVPYSVRVIECDLRNRDRVFGALGALSPDYVIHHAALVDAPGSIRDPHGHFQNNVIGSINLIDACVAVDVRRIVFASSGAAIYGEILTGSAGATESTLPKPETPYGAGKLAVEHVLAAQRENGDAPESVSLRYPNVYGPRQLAGVIGVFMRAALRGENLRVYGGSYGGTPGSENVSNGGLRDYVYVDDVARANIMALSSSGCSVVNVPGEHASVGQLARRVLEMVQTTSAIKQLAARPGDIQRSLVNGDKFKRDFFSDLTSLDDGLTRTLAWWNKQ